VNTAETALLSEISINVKSLRFSTYIFAEVTARRIPFIDSRLAGISKPTDISQPLFE
jgi:hypothetical protein